MHSKFWRLASLLVALLAILLGSTTALAAPPERAVSLTGPATATRGETITLVATSDAANPSDTFVLQRLDGGTWTEIASVSRVKELAVYFQQLIGDYGDFTYRAVLRGKAPEDESISNVLTVSAPVPEQPDPQALCSVAPWDPITDQARIGNATAYLVTHTQTNFTYSCLAVFKDDPADTTPIAAFGYKYGGVDDRDDYRPPMTTGPTAKTSCYVQDEQGNYVQCGFKAFYGDEWVKLDVQQ